MTPLTATVFLCLTFVLGVIVGIVFYEILLHRAARLTRNGGRSETEVVGRTYLPGGETHTDGMPPSLEQEDANRAKTRILERGADDYQERFPELTRKEAMARAHHALESSGAFRPMGGIPGV